MSRKPFSVPDGVLWDEVRASVRPLGRRPKPVPPASMAHPVVAATRPRPAVAAPAAPPRPARATPPPLTGLDRRTEQRLTRGKVDIDARLDLHGSGVEMARGTLHAFLARRRAEGARLVLVITGKGASPFARHTLHGRDHFHAPEREGRLRRAVTDWFHDADFRGLLSGFQPAHPRHGGGGAFYVKLRRLREP